MEATDQLALGLDDVEGRSVELGRDRDDEDDERHDAETDQVPVPDAAAWDVTMSGCTESDPVTSTTVTIVMPRAAS